MLAGNELAPPAAAALAGRGTPESLDLTGEVALPELEVVGDGGPEVELPQSLARRPTGAGDPLAPKSDLGSVQSAGSAGSAGSGPEDTESAPGGAQPGESDGPSASLAWQRAEELYTRLALLEGRGPTRAWATETREAVDRLGRAFSDNWSDVGLELDRLQQLSARVPQLARALEDRELARQLLRAGHALERRLGIWGEIYRQAGQPGRAGIAQSSDTRRLAAALDTVDRLLPATREGRAWRDYLLFDALRESLGRGAEPSDRLRATAQEVVRRMSQSPMAVEQQRFLTAAPFVSLFAELQVAAAEPIDPGRLLADLERYEHTRLLSDAQRLARDCQSLRWSPDPSQQRLGQWVEAYYRNANVRLCVSAELLNRWMPHRDPEYITVRDTILGRPVRGRSLTSADVVVRTLPDPHRARLALEVSGHVSSLTSSWAGPARFWNDSNAVYIARLPLELDLSGIHVGQTQVQVFNNVRLRDLETDFDRIPLFGALAQGVARAQHEQSLPAARQEASYKIAARAREKIEAETSQQLTAASQRLEQQVLLPLGELALRPVLIHAATDERRFAMRLRIAGDDQLGSQTPRPQAPSDSLASVQFHETALNNALARLELDGRTFSLDELAMRISQRLKCGRPWEANPEHEDVTITFAEQNPITVRFDEGQVVVTVSVVQLAKPPRIWENFQVRAFYRPEINGRSARLVREGVVRLIGPRLNLGSQIALRGIFSRTFSRKHPWELTPQRVRESAQMSDLEITQFLLEDGWVGVALGPRRTIQQRTAMSGR